MSDVLSTLGYVTEESAAIVLDVKIPTLRNQRAKRTGPPFCKVGGTVLYPLDGLRKYLAQHTVQTADHAPTLIHGRRRATTSAAQPSK